MSSFAITQLASGGLITNYFCTSRCRHCLYNSGPNREKRYITPRTAEKNLIVIRSLGCRSVHIGGGEPMLRPDDLGTVLKIARKLGVAIEYVETNSSWFIDLKSAKSTLLQLKQKGLQTLLISISPFHNEFISFNKMRGVMEAAGQTGIGLFPWIGDFISNLSSFDASRSHSLEEYEEKFGQDFLSRVLQRYWVHLGGRALETFRPVLETRSADQILNDGIGGCKGELSATTHFHIDLDGNYIPGLCSGLSIALEDLGKPLVPHEYPVLTTLFDSGIRGLFEMAQKELSYEPAEDGYLNKCDLCTEIRTRFVENGIGGEQELNPKEFYLLS